ncbi:hypothetical protein EB796_022938 [Bugula neritina]|uniref:F-box domain-containing protein n=1 Tax=Bugula neritina TaxID=10212 RepID=A0A7J7IXU0_BUGNE|nr:hypothetical protein EB796_022938 [Bugula neritina]
MAELAQHVRWGMHKEEIGAVPFDKQLDKLHLWMETWNHVQRCELIEKLLLHMNYDQYRFLWTVLQPSLHRDFMYSAQIVHPKANFQPLSTHISRKLKENAGRNRRNNFHRVKSAYCEFPEEVLQKNALPELSRIRHLSFNSQIKRKRRAHFSAKTHLPHIDSTKSKTSILFDSTAEPEDIPSSLRITDQPIRRHIQQEKLAKTAAETEMSLSIFKGLQLLPPNAIQVVDWYNNDWSDTQRNEFLKKLLLKLDERQHFFISNLLSVKQYKDFITLLPLHISLKILSYLTPNQLVKASRVCRSWRKTCERNELWKSKCKELNMNVSDYHPTASAISKVNYKKLLKNYLNTLENWETGRYRDLELRGHSQNVLCVCLEHKRTNPRLASGSMDKSIKIWDLRSAQCTMTLKGHSKGIWSLNFYTSTLLISGSYDTTIRVFCVDMDKTGEFAFSASADHTVRIWSIEDGSCTKVIYVNQTMAVMTVGFNQGYLACSYGEFLALYKIAASNFDFCNNSLEKPIAAYKECAFKLSIQSDVAFVAYPILAEMCALKANPRIDSEIKLSTGALFA